MPCPYWVSYIEIMKLAEVFSFCSISIENDFKITGEQLQNAITEKTKLMIFNTM